MFLVEGERDDKASWRPYSLKSRDEERKKRIIFNNNTNNVRAKRISPRVVCVYI